MLKILLVGCGKMGGALANGWLDQGQKPSNILVIEPDQNITGALISKGVRFHMTVDDLPPDDEPNAVVFAVKPQVMDDIIPPYAKFADCAVFVSIAAGKTIDYFEKILGHDAAIVRVMPNTPVAVRRGISGAFANANVSINQQKVCNELMEAVGELHWLENEGQLDAVTAVSGSGPAYVFLLAECLAEAAKNLGISEKLAERLGRATISGSGELLYQSEEDITTLRRNVTSPGGTTEAALDILMGKDALKALIKDAVKKAAERSKELAR